MKIDAQLVKKLRDRCGAGILDCKKALEANNGDIDKSIDWLREKGIAKAATKADRIAAEGLCNVVSEGNFAVIYELNSETDFVAKNEKFLALIEKIGKILLANKVKSTEEALKIVSDNKALSEILLEATSVIGEKITLRRVTLVEKKQDQVFGVYKHQGGRIVVLSVLSKDEALAKDICLHVAAINPLYLSSKDITPEVIAKEKDILFKEAQNENKTAAKPKPEQILIKVVEGRLNKYLQEICLLNQQFVKNPDLTVENYLKQHNAEVVSFTRLEVGEGIEKAEVDFAAEVMQQVKKG